MNLIDNHSSCLNCGQELLGEHCVKCGQKKAIRLTTKTMLYTTIHNFFSFERGFFLTFKEMTIKPWVVIQTYIEGTRKKYHNPIRYLIVSLFLYSSYLLIFPAEDQLIAYGASPEQVKETQLGVIKWLENYMQLLLFSMAPIISLFTWLFFKKKKYNYAENLTANFYIFAHVNFLIVIFNILMALFFKGAIVATGTIGFVIQISYLSWVYIKIFEDSIFKGIIKSFLAFMITLVVFMLIIIMVMIISKASIIQGVT